jgi:hypothetical protein
VPAPTWALLFGLPDPEKAGAARVSAAIKALHEAEIVAAEQRQGREPKVRALHEAGDGRAWTSPVGEQGKAHAEEDLYAQLDADFWRNGWITVLSARAIAALVILLDATWGQKKADRVDEEVREGLVRKKIVSLPWWHLTEAQILEQYGLSRDLFDRGVSELETWQLVETRRRAVGDRTTWSDRRWYRELRVRLETLHTPVADVAADKIVPRVGHSSEDPLLTLLSEAGGDKPTRRRAKKVRHPTQAAARQLKK